MWVWGIMLIFDLLIPSTMFGFGLLFMKRPPQKINGEFGYRTSRSMKNKDAWEFAHKYCGKIWCICGGIMIPATVIALLFVLKEAEGIVATVGGIVCVVQLVFLIGSIVPTERALKKNFDYYGFRKK